MNNVTAVLITRHAEYPKEIVLDGFNEVIIKTHSPSVFQRYIEAEKAVNDIIYVQDDDAILDYKELFKHYNGQITNGITEHHKNSYAGSGVTLVGWGCFFPKSMLKSFGPYIDKYGMDAHLLREADRIFTFFNQPHNTIVMPHQDLAQTPDRMSLEPDHYESSWVAIAKAKLCIK